MESGASGPRFVLSEGQVSFKDSLESLRGLVEMIRLRRGRGHGPQLDVLLSSMLSSEESMRAKGSHIAYELQQLKYKL